MDIQTIILAVIFVAAALVVVRHLKSTLTGPSCNCADKSKASSCESSCSGCRDSPRPPGEK